MPLPTLAPLTTDRLLLRTVQAGDLADLMAVNSDAEVTRFLPYSAWQGLDDARSWYARMVAAMAEGTAQQLVLVDRASARVLGSALLFRFDAGSQRAELGYVLGRAAWRQGLMAEALRALLDQAFSVAGLRRIEAEVDPRNDASHQLLLRLGFGHEGTARQRWVNHGQPCDVHRYGLLRDDWRAAPRLGAAPLSAPTLPPG